MSMRPLVCLGALLIVLVACTPSIPMPTPEVAVELTAVVSPAAPSAAVPTPGSLAGLEGRLMVWHVFSTDSPPERALRDVLDQLQRESPAVEISVLQFPANQIEAKFIDAVETEWAADVLIAPDDIMRRLAAADLIAPRTRADIEPQDFIPGTIEAFTVDGKQVGLPLVVNATLLFYNREALNAPPTSRVELIAATERGLVVSASARDLLPWMTAFGGGTAEPVVLCADQGASAAAWLDSLGQLAGEPEVAFWHAQAPVGDALFRTGEAAMMIDSSRELPRYHAALGERLAIAPLPGGLAQIVVDGVGVHAETENTRAAETLARVLAGHATAEYLAQAGGYLPARADVVSADPLVSELAAIAGDSVPQPPLSASSRAFDMAFDAAVIQVVEGGVDPGEAARSACEALSQ